MAEAGALESARLFFAKSSGSNAARAAFPTGRTLPDNRRGDHVTGAPEQSEAAASTTFNEDPEKSWHRGDGETSLYGGMKGVCS